MRDIESFEDLKDCFVDEPPMTGLAWVQFSNETIDKLHVVADGLEQLIERASLAMVDRQDLREGLAKLRQQIRGLSYPFDSKHYRHQHRLAVERAEFMMADLVESVGRFIREKQDEKESRDRDQLAMF